MELLLKNARINDWEYDMEIACVCFNYASITRVLTMHHP